MRLDLDWGSFLGALPAWEALPIPARRTLLTAFSGKTPDSTVKRSLVAPHAETLLDAGFLDPLVGGTQIAVPSRRRPLLAGLLDLQRVPVFEQAPDLPLLERYLGEHLVGAELEGLARAKVYFGQRELAALRISSVDWVRDLLKARTTGGWEEHQVTRGAGKRRFLAEPRVGEMAKKLLEHLAAAGPLPFRELRHAFEGVPLPDFAKALAGGLRYALILAGLRAADLLPVAGLWPPVQKRLAEPPAEPPARAVPRETFDAPFGLEDMATVLASFLARPPRIRVNDFQLFAKAAAETEAALTPLPEWLEKAAFRSRAYRLEWTLRILQSLELAAVDYGARRQPTLAVTPIGILWLRLAEPERLRQIWPPGHVRKEKMRKSVPSGKTLPFLSAVSPLADREVGLVAAAFSSLPAGEPVELESFLHFQTRRRNPWATGDAPRLTYPTPYGVVATATLEQQETTWRTILTTFLFARLVPLGGGALGVTDEGKLTLAVTALGRYLLGQADDFPLPARAAAQIVVQPNFDIVFLTPSGVHEAIFSRFAERKGRGVGTLFRITKKSILAAAALGGDARQILAELESASRQAIPANVRREIESWFGQVRTVTLRPIVAVICPDAETAARVATGGKKVRLLAETLVEIQDLRTTPTLLRKLRENGILVTEEMPPGFEEPDFDEFDDPFGDFDDGDDDDFFEPPRRTARSGRRRR